MHTPIDKFIMLSAMYENGGNTTHRLLDGHPELFVYPFESQIGTKYVNDYLSGMFPLKYRWPIFPNSMSLDELYHSIIDEECKVRSITPFVSKFRDYAFDFSNDARREFFKEELADRPLTRANIVQAFFAATFRAWKDYKRSGKESCYVGYSPIIGVDGGNIVSDYAGKGYVLHVVRNPFSAYADTKKRAVPLSLNHYMMGWTICQQLATYNQTKYPDQFFVVRFEDIVKDPMKVLGDVLQKVGIGTSETLKTASWNGQKMDQVYPWGTVRTPTEEANLNTAKELSPAEISEIYARTAPWIKHFGFDEIYNKLV